jgi:hypothetical protein
MPYASITRWQTLAILCRVCKESNLSVKVCRALVRHDGADHLFLVGSCQVTPATCMHDTEESKISVVASGTEYAMHNSGK